MTDKNIDWYQNKKIENLSKLLLKRNITLKYAKTKAEATKIFEELVPKGSVIGLSGSMTLEELGLLDTVLTSEYKTINQYEKGISREESLKRRNLGAQADYFLSGANAVTYDGKIVNFSAFGHRIAGLSNAGRTIIFAGTNKLVTNLDEALKRVRNYTVPINSQRLNYATPCLETLECNETVCNAVDYKRMCNQILILEGEVVSGRLYLVMVEGSYGY
ncbi:MAG: lactate utilization protein [Nitrospinae bacterium]|nr:lactate utilization protein [Nitrospinota bacterium]